MAIEPKLQDCVERYLRSLKVMHKLIALHPRTKGHPGNAAALAPAIVLSVLPAFEGFAEDLVSTAMYQAGRNFGQIAKMVGNWNNPTLRDLQKALVKEFSGVRPPSTDIDIYDPPPVGGKSTWWATKTISWNDALTHSEGWMQVRHNLTHGLATGLGSEHWPGPLREGVAATHVLREMKEQKHSLVLHGAISCARIYVWGAMHLSQQLATEIGDTVDWSRLPDLNI